MKPKHIHAPLWLLSWQEQVECHREKFNAWFDCTMRPILDQTKASPETIALSEHTHWQLWLKKLKR